jgi:NAD(P)-dependent dehydrogenase (short-subunit alcohol dehydrogenase family)
MGSMTVDLSGKVVALTGASGALGRAAAVDFTKFGAVVAHLDHGKAAEGALHFGGTDLADESAAAAVFAKIVAQTGRLDALVNVAGGFAFEKFEGGNVGHWDAMYRQNLRTAVVCCQAALPHLLNSGAGRIVNIGAQGAEHAGAGMGAYAASKAGVAKLTEALSAEFKTRGITVNAILPSIMDTERNRLDMPQADFSRWVPLGAVADLMAFLVSDAAASITGALIPITGKV